MYLLDSKTVCGLVVSSMGVLRCFGLLCVIYDRIGKTNSVIGGNAPQICKQ